MKDFLKFLTTMTSIAIFSVACGGDDGGGGDGAAPTDSTVNSTDDTGQTGNTGNNTNTDTETNTDTTINPPSSTAGVLSFTDTDNDYRELTGTLGITKSTDESDIDQYVIYWGSDATTKSGAAIQEVSKTGSDLNFAFTDESIPAGATHFLVYSKNAGGESASAASINITEIVSTFAEVESGADDIAWIPGVSATTGGLSIPVGVENPDDTFASFSAILRFASPSIPQGATITSAELFLHWSQITPAGGTLEYDLYAHDVDNSAGCSDLASCDAISSNITAAMQVSPNIAAQANTSPQGQGFIQTVIQEVVNRPGFSDTSALTLVLMDPVSTIPDAGSQNVNQLGTFEDGGTFPIRLVYSFSYTL